MDQESLEFQNNNMRKRVWHLLARIGLGLVWLGSEWLVLVTKIILTPPSPRPPQASLKITQRAANPAQNISKMN